MPIKKMLEIEEAEKKLSEGESSSDDEDEDKKSDAGDKPALENAGLDPN